MIKSRYTDKKKIPFNKDKRYAIFFKGDRLDYDTVGNYIVPTGASKEDTLAVYEYQDKDELQIVLELEEGYKRIRELEKAVIDYTCKTLEVNSTLDKLQNKIVGAEGLILRFDKVEEEILKATKKALFKIESAEEKLIGTIGVSEPVNEDLRLATKEGRRTLTLLSEAINSKKTAKYNGIAQIKALAETKLRDIDNEGREYLNNLREEGKALARAVHAEGKNALSLAERALKKQVEDTNKVLREREKELSRGVKEMTIIDSMTFERYVITVKDGSLHVHKKENK